MDFEKVLPLILNEFKRENVHYALMGGVAMSAWGVVRATVDLDYLVLAEDMEKIEKIMQKYGYQCIYKTENVSQYRSDLKIYGSIDFLHAFRETARAMLERAVVKKVYNEQYEVRVLCPEDLVGLKVQAMVNDPEREMKEKADIDSIAIALGSQLDWKVIEDYYRMLNKSDDFEVLKRKYVTG